MRAAKIISVLLHPLWLPMLSMLLLLNAPYYFNQFISPAGTTYLFMVVLFDNILIPIIFVILLKGFRLIESIYLHNQAERQGPLLFGAVFFVVSARMLNQAELPAYYWFFLLCTSVVMGLALMINARYRISLHMLGWGAFTGMLLSLLIWLEVPVLWILPMALFVSGVVGWARMKLKSHSSGQIYAGYAVGLLTFPLSLIWL